MEKLNTRIKKFFYPKQQELKVKFSLDEKKIISKFINAIGGVDYDGYYGHLQVPEEIMVVYREMFSKEWDKWN